MVCLSLIVVKNQCITVLDNTSVGFLQKKQMLELVSNNAEVINIIGKPILKKALGFMRSI